MWPSARSACAVVCADASLVELAAAALNRSRSSSAAESVLSSARDFAVSASAASASMTSARHRASPRAYATTNARTPPCATSASRHAVECSTTMRRHRAAAAAAATSSAAARAASGGRTPDAAAAAPAAGKTRPRRWFRSAQSRGARPHASTASNRSEPPQAGWHLRHVTSARANAGVSVGRASLACPCAARRRAPSSARARSAPRHASRASASAAPCARSPRRNSCSRVLRRASPLRRMRACVTLRSVSRSAYCTSYAVPFVATIVPG